MMVDKTGIGTSRTQRTGVRSQSSEDSTASSQDDPEEEAAMEDVERPSKEAKADDPSGVPEKGTGGQRTKSNQRWMKLRTTVQLSGAISNTIQKSKPTLKREDSFLKRFSTRQMPETQETVDTGDETEPTNGSRNQDEVSRRRRKRRKELSRTVVNPDENFYFYWLMTVTFCVLYNLWTLIVRQSFPELQREWTPFWYACDSFTDVVFVCDIVVQFRTGYLEQGLMVYDSKKLAGHYLRSRAFIFDLLSLVPLDLLQIEIGMNPILRFPRFLKIYRVYSYYYMVESRTVYPNLWRVVNLIHILLILAHWFGCFYYLLSEAEGFRGAWVYPYRQGDDATLTRKYLGSLYWSTLTLTTIGDLPTPETNAEYIFTIISYLIGVFIFATIVGQVGNVITNRNANRLEFERLLDGAKTYMRHHKVPGGMKRRVLRWYDYSWSRGRIQGGGDINTALGLLPDKLKTELALHVNLSVLKKVTIFQECQPEFLHDLVLKMKAYIFTPGDLICRKGEIAREMFIIADGILDVISETGRVLTTMKAGDFFGEIGILNLDGLNKRTADVRSVGYSELFSLSREDVLTAMKDYPEAQEILQSLGRKRLMEAKNASKVHKSQGKKFRDYESSGESDNAGKRIVEKLRSDVKGLKNVLRRSRKGAPGEDSGDGYLDNYSSKAQDKKQSILRRMSHVQSSEENEIVNEVQTPIAVGLPLLQRLRLLKEKQEKEKDEKSKLFVSQPKKDADMERDPIRARIPPVQRLVSLQEKEDSDDVYSGNSAAAKSPAADVEKDSSLVKSKSASSTESDGSKFLDEATANLQPSSAPKTLSEESDESPLSKHAQDFKMPKDLNVSVQEPSNSETSINVPNENGKIVHSVPKEALGNKLEVPKRYNIPNKSSVERTKTSEKNAISRTINRGPYLSKSDTVFEKKRSGELAMEKRSRSISPSDDAAKVIRRRFKSTVEYLMREKREGRSLIQGDRKTDDVVDQAGNWESTAECASSRIKKYNSIDDLSPEFSGLPFVKKLKILNERQKLAELVEKELSVVRSASLDVPERVQARDATLIRSCSVASSIELDSDSRINPRATYQKDRKVFPLRTRLIGPEHSFPAGSPKNKLVLGSNISLHSPESNETLERRHLKSILKKLSADGGTGDEDRYSKVGNLTRRRDRSEDLKRLMRAPTIEGYAARHTKLTKSVTFDRETVQSPIDSATIETAVAETKCLPPANSIITHHVPYLCSLPITDRVQRAERIEWGDAQGSTALDLTKSPQNVDVNERVNESVLNPNSVSPYEDAMQIVQGHLNVIHRKLSSQFQDFERELKKRDDLIHDLKLKIEQLQFQPGALPSSEPEKSGGSESLEVDVYRQIEADPPEDKFDDNRTSFPLVGQPFEVSTTTSPQGSFTSSELEGDRINADSIGQTSSSTVFTSNLRPSMSDRAEGEELELLELNASVPCADGYYPSTTDLDPHCRGKVAGGNTMDDRESNNKSNKDQKTDPKSKGSLINRVTEFGRSLSRSNDFVALDIDSSNSSDLEEPHNNDWEIQMLLEEMSKKEKMEERRANEERQMQEMKRLEEDVNTLKEMVCESNLSCFSASELDMLETIIEAKNQKISEIASSSCFDITNQKGNHAENQGVVAKRESRRRSFFRCKLGHALSFDFHDIDGRRKKTVGQRKAPPLRKQKTISCSYQEKQSLDNLLHAGLVRNRLLEESRRLWKFNRSSSNNSRSSLPLIMSQSPTAPKNIRTSLPTLSRRDHKRCLNECPTSSISSSDDACPESDANLFFKENQIEKNKTMDVSSQASVAGFAGIADGQGSLNNFIKTVGQRVKQAVSGDSNTVKDQVPTISKLCEERSSQRETKTDCPVDAVSEDGQRDKSKTIDRFDYGAEIDSANL